MPVVRSSRLAFTLCLLLLGPGWSMAQAGPPQAPLRDRLPPPRTGNAVVKGKVVDGVTGAPVARARVRLMNGGAPRAAVLSDGQGQFTFPGAVAGPFTVMAEKASYIAGRYPETQRSLRARSTPPLLRDGQTVDVVVPMFRSSAIAGRVLDAHGDPVEYADIRVMTMRRGQPPSMRSQSSTNDLGEFRVGRLDSGKYLVMVIPRAVGPEEPPGVVIQTPLPVPMPMYYPNATAIDQAQPITLNRAETISGLDFTLAEGTPTVINGNVVGAEGPLTEVNGSVSVRVAGPETMGGMFQSGGTGLRADGTFRLQLPPGDYILEAQISPRVSPNQPYQPRNQQFGRVRVSLGGNPVESVTIVTGRGATATGRVVFEGTSAVPAPPNGGETHIQLFGEGPACRSGQATIAPDWTFKVDGLGGICSAPLPGMIGRWTVKSVMFRGQNIVDRTITFEQGQQYTNLQIVVTDKRPEVELFVAGDDGQPTREYVALAYPVEKSRWQPRLVRPLVPRTRLAVPPPGTGGAGSLSVQATLTLNGQQPPGAAPQSGPLRDMFTSLTAGEHYIVAVDDIDAEDYTDPAVLERLVPHATRVMVSDEAQVEVRLRRVPIADIIR